MRLTQFTDQMLLMLLSVAESSHSLSRRHRSAAPGFGAPRAGLCLGVPARRTRAVPAVGEPQILPDHSSCRQINMQPTSSAVTVQLMADAPLDQPSLVLHSHHPESAVHDVAMNWADLVLSYIRVLVWPAVAIAALWVFRNPIRELILNIKSIIGPGVQVETWEKTELRIRRTELDLEQSEAIDRKLTQNDGQEGSDIVSSVRALLTFNLAELDSSDPLSATDEIASKVETATQQALHYFGVPAIISYQNAAALMTKNTGEDIWEGYLEELYELQKDWAPVKEKLQKRGISQADRAVLENAAKSLAGFYFRLSRVLPDMVERGVYKAKPKGLSLAWASL